MMSRTYAHMLLSRCFQHSGLDKSAPKLMKAQIDAYSEGTSTLVQVQPFKFAVDEPPKLGGRGLGPNSLSYFLGSLVACTSYTISIVSKEMKIAEPSCISWSASGEYDLRGLQGSVDGVDARFRSLHVTGTVDTEVSQEDCDKLASALEKRCIVAATVGAVPGIDMRLSLRKGAVDHACQPECELHAWEGNEEGSSGREADSPQYVGSGGGGGGSGGSRGFHSSAGQGMNGEDEARKNLHAEVEPQLQKKPAETAPFSDSCAYASRDSPRAQAGPPTEGKSDEQLVEEQTAGANTKPEEALNKEHGTEDPRGRGIGAPKSSDFPEKAYERSKDGKSPLGDQPSGVE